MEMKCAPGAAIERGVAVEVSDSGVTVRGLDIRAHGHNNDGIDVNASRNVLIENCTLDQGDDGFVIKSGRDRDGRRVGVPCENVEIRNCTVKRAHTLIGVGSEVSGGIRNISLHDCKVTERVSAVVRVKTSDRKGAFVENVVASNVCVAATANIGALVSLDMDIDYQWGKYPPREHIVTRIDGVRVAKGLHSTKTTSCRVGLLTIVAPKPPFHPLSRWCW